MDRDEILRLGPALDAFLSEFESCAIAPTRKLIAAYVRGQLGPLPRKSVMPMARDAGIAPRTLQELLSLHRWDEERMREILRDRARRLLGGPRSVAVFHETACVKKGEKTPGVDRQHCDARGKVVNCCRILHLAVSDGPFRTVLESDLYLPERWISDRARRKAAGIPDEVRGRTPAKIALDLIGRALSGGADPGTILLGETLAGDPMLLRELSERKLRYVASLPAQMRGWAPPVRGSEKPRSLEAVAARVLPPWRIVSPGEEARPDRDRPPAEMVQFCAEVDGSPGPALSVLALRHPWTGEARFLATSLPASLPEGALVDLALSRRPLETRIERDLADIGFDQFEVRAYRSLQRHLTLSALSLLFLAEMRSRLQAGEAADKRAGGDGTSRLAANSFF